MDVASDPPLAFTLVLWVGAFAAVTWGMMVLFGRRPGHPPPGSEPPEPLERDEPTMDAPPPEER
jgi:cytochrome c-type biogenesis protein CcmH/NrfF